MISRVKTVFLSLLCVLTGFASSPSIVPGHTSEKMVGIYIHTAWPFNHPYAARTWTVEDWRGYLSGIRALGYNTVFFWPLLETMPDPLTESDRQFLEKTAHVIEIARKELGMRIYLVVCPNIVPDSAVASQATFEERIFYHSDLRVNPDDERAVAAMMRRRGELFKSLSDLDGLVVIDSDPAGYPNSGNAAFVNLLLEHRKMLDRLRPGIELVYWMHAGWPAYGRYYATHTFKRGTPAEFAEAMTMLKEHNPEPWLLANNLAIATKLGLEDRVINFSYGQIEQEPQLPLTNFWSERAFKAGSDAAPRGVVGNAQSHVLQLPNTFAFAQGAQNKPIGPEDYRTFAEQLIPGCGDEIERAWRAFASNDSAEMRAAAVAVSHLDHKSLQGGPLQGLLMGDPGRFVTDLKMQLRFAASYVDLLEADKLKSDLLEPLAEFADAASDWQQRTGYQSYWKWRELRTLLSTLGSPEIDAVLSPVFIAETPFGQVKESDYRRDRDTTMLLNAIHATVARMRAAKTN